ncbi:MAG: hypothetical protein ACI8RW_001020 [Porticoccaceae bacterium]|jgi:hypothetical protein
MRLLGWLTLIDLDELGVYASRTLDREFLVEQLCKAEVTDSVCDKIAKVYE